MMAGKQARVDKVFRHVEGPHDVGGLAGLHPHRIRFGVRHPPHAMHRLVVFGDLARAAEYELMREIAVVDDVRAPGCALREMLRVKYIASVMWIAMVWLTLRTEPGIPDDASHRVAACAGASCCVGACVAAKADSRDANADLCKIVRKETQPVQP